MRLACACLTLLACGRIGFDSHDQHVGGCPGAPLVHDEDGDGLGDICDPCPHIAGDAADADGDGVGDACDPHPGEVDRIAAFLAFDELPAGWTVNVTGGGSWRIDDDDLVFDLDASNIGLLRAPITTATHLRVDTAVHVDRVNPSSDGIYRNVAIVDNVAAPVTPGNEYCLWFGVIDNVENASPAELSILPLISGGNPGTLVTTQLPQTLGVRDYVLSYERHGDTRRVTDGATSISITATEARTGGDLGLRPRGVLARYHYLLVIESATATD